MRVDDLRQELDALAAIAPVPPHDPGAAVRRGRARRNRAWLFQAAAVTMVCAVATVGLVRIERDQRHDVVRAGAPSSTSDHPRPPRGALGDRALPPRGLIVLDSPRDTGSQQPASWSIALLNDEGSVLAQLPRATLPNDVVNQPWNAVVADNTSVSINHAPLDASGGAPTGCTVTVSTPVPVALCGSRSGDQLLGSRIMIDGPAGWSALVDLPPPTGAGRQPLGHWSWAVPSPDGRWVLAQWSGECESQTGMLISVADSSVRAITGEQGPAWANAPASEILGWTVDGQAIFQLEASCDAPARSPGIYEVAPANGTRHLLRALSPTALVLRWSALSDLRTSESGTG
jgi:hypothetical protein